MKKGIRKKTYICGNSSTNYLIDWLWMPGSPGRTRLSIRRCTTYIVSYYYHIPPPPSSERSSIDIWVNLRGWSLPECFLSSVGSFTSTLNVRLEGTSALRDMRATRGTPLMLMNREINLSIFFWHEWQVC